MADAEQIQLWHEQGYRWFRFRFVDEDTEVLAFEVSTIHYENRRRAWDCFPVSITTWLSDPAVRESSAVVWQWEHPDWVRKPGPYGRT